MAKICQCPWYLYPHMRIQVCGIPTLHTPHRTNIINHFSFRLEPAFKVNTLLLHLMILSEPPVLMPTIPNQQRKKMCFVQDYDVWHCPECGCANAPTQKSIACALAMYKTGFRSCDKGISRIEGRLPIDDIVSLSERTSANCKWCKTRRGED